MRERERLNALIRMGKHPAPAADQGTHSAESLDISEAGDGWSDSEIAGGPRNQRRHGCPDAPATWWKKASEGGSGPQAFAGLGQTGASLTWSRGRRNWIALACSEPPKGPQAVDIAAARGGRRGAAHCRPRQRQHNRADAKKNILKPHLQKQWVIPPEAKCGVRSQQYGRCAGGLSPAARSGVSRGVLGRGFKATDDLTETRVIADPGEARTTYAA